MHKYPTERKTIGGLAVALMRMYRLAEPASIVRAVKLEFPRSRFNADHVTYYRSQVKRGLFQGGRRRAS